MKTEFHTADSRGHANHGWLESYHSFSFAQYYNPQRMQFGTLRVLNDDRVAAGMGFGTHSHQNMEIISIPLQGDLEHKDSMGNIAVIREGDVQVMSAGTGVAHSEYNRNKDQEVRFLQIWVLPRQANVSPRYDQISLEPGRLKNNFYTILGPEEKHDGLWIHQDAWFHLGHFEAGKSASYSWRNPDHGLYIFLLEGQVNIGETSLKRRDALGVWEASAIDLEFTEDSQVLLMEVPMSN